MLCYFWWDKHHLGQRHWYAPFKYHIISPHSNLIYTFIESYERFPSPPSQHNAKCCLYGLNLCDHNSGLNIKMNHTFSDWLVWIMTYPYDCIPICLHPMQVYMQCVTGL